MIDMKGIIKRFYVGEPNELQILNGIDLQVKEGEFVAIVGESGSGKSTLMNIIGVLDRPTEGSYNLDGVDVEKLKDRDLSDIRNQKIGFVFQTFNLIPRTNALRNVELPMLYAGVPMGQRNRRAKELLDGSPQKEPEEAMLCSQVAQNQRLLARCLEIDKRISRSVDGKRSFYTKYR